MGTVRMEAFIDNSLNNGNGSKLAASQRVGAGRRRNSNWSNSTIEPSRAGGVYEEFLYEPNDPFRGF
jgi:hypothetical protein